MISKHFCQISIITLLLNSATANTSELFSKNSGCYNIMQTLCSTKRNGKIIVPKNEQKCQRKLIKNITIVPESCKNSLLDELGVESLTNVRTSSTGMVFIKATKTEMPSAMTEEQRKQDIIRKYGNDAFKEMTFMNCDIKKWEFKKFKEDNMKKITNSSKNIVEEKLRQVFKKEMKKFGCKY